MRMTKTITLKENRAAYSVSLDKTRTIDAPVILKRGRRRVAAIIPIVEYEQFVTWRKRQRRAPKPKGLAKSRRTRVSRKTGTLTDLIGFFQAAPGEGKIQFEELMKKHGYEQIDRDDS
jgi:hypothetical protein